MPPEPEPEPLPFNRKDLVKESKPSSSDPVGIVPSRWRESPTASSYHNNHGSSSSCRWAGGGGPSDLRRPFSGHGKPVGGGSHITTVESGPREHKYCRNDNGKVNRVSVALGRQKDLKGGHSWETTVSPNGNFHPLSDSVSSWEQLHLNDQHAKNNGGQVSNTGGQRLEKANSLGSSLDWKPLKWIRSGSLSSRGSGFSHASSFKSTRVDSLDIKIDAPPSNNTPLQSPSGDAAPCLTPRRPADEASSRKKPRLGWGEGLAKYEKKKVGPDDIVNNEAGARNGMVDGVSSSEPLLPSPSNLPDKSLNLTGFSGCESPTTPYSFACSSSQGLDEKASIKAATVGNDTCNPGVASCHLSQNHREGLAFNLENLELTEDFNLRPSLDELLQSDDSSGPRSGFVRSTAMNKLHVWKADISRTLEVTESEIDSLEYELKSLISDGGSCSFPAASSSLPAERNNKNTEHRCGPSPLRIISSGDMHVEKAVGSLEERTGVEVLDRESPGTATSKLVEPLALCNEVKHSDAVEQRDSPSNLDIRSEKAKCPLDLACDDMLGVATSCGDGSQVPTGSSTIPIRGDVHYGREDKFYDSILASNKVLASRASDELSKLLPTTHLCANISRATDESLINKKIAMRKRFIKFKERVITLKFWALQYSWKEDLHLLSIRSGAKSQKKFELSSRMGYADHQKHYSIHSRLSSAGSLSLVPTKEMVDYVNTLLSDSWVRIYRNALKMPSFILDKRERIASRFISDNGLVENPIDVEKERSVVNPWTLEEKEVFLDKYSLFGKNFRKIASFFEHKTIADCVEFYYKNHKSDRFQKTKKNLEFSKGKSNTTNTYLVTSGKRLNRATSAASLDMLGAASTMVANVNGEMRRQQQATPNFYVGTSSDQKQPRGDGSILEVSNNFAMICNEQETVAADVLAGICESISSEALGSCIKGSVDPGVVHQLGRRFQKFNGFLKRQQCQKFDGFLQRQHLTPEGALDDVDEETCSDDSCGEEMVPSDWTDEEKLSFIQAVRSYGKDFSMISRYMGTRSRDQCRVFFSKAQKCLGLDVIDLEPDSEGTTGANQGSGSDHEDACMVDSGSVVSHDKSSSEYNRMDVEDLHLSDFREEHAESDQNLVNGCREPELVLGNLGCEAQNKPGAELVGERSSNDNLEGAADSEATEAAANLEEAPRNSLFEGSAGEMNYFLPASGAKFEPDTVAKVSAEICGEGIRESEHQLPGGDRCIGNDRAVKGLSSCPAEDINSASHFSKGSSLDLSLDHANNEELNGSEKVASQEPGNGFLMSNWLSQDPTVFPNRKTLSQDDASSRLSFRKSGDRLSQRSSSTDGYHLHLPKRSLLDCEESSQILRGYPVTISAKKGKNGSVSYNEPQINHKLDQNLLMDPSLPRELISDASGSQEQRQSLSPDVEKPSRNGDVKLFGQILTNHSSQPWPNANGGARESGESIEKQNGGKFVNLKFDNHSNDRKLASLDLDQNNIYSFGMEKNVPLRSYGFWDGNRIQTGFSSLPDSAVLLAKYPAAFNNTPTPSKLDPHSSLKRCDEQWKLNNVMSGYQSRKQSLISSSNSYPELVQPFTGEKFLLPEMPRRKEMEQGRSMKEGGIVVGGACNGVSDPVAAIRMHYAKTGQYKNGGESWRI